MHILYTTMLLSIYYEIQKENICRTIKSINQSRAVGKHFFHSHDPNVCFRGEARSDGIFSPLAAMHVLVN